MKDYDSFSRVILFNVALFGLIVVLGLTSRLAVRPACGTPCLSCGQPCDHPWVPGPPVGKKVGP